MIRIAVFLSCFLHATAWADLTLQGTHSPGISGGADREVIYLRNDQMRIDQLSTTNLENEVGEGVASSMLIRFSGSPAGWLFLDHESKRVQILSSLRETSTASSASSVSVVTQGETLELLGQTAHRYDFSFAGDVDPLALLGQQLPAVMAGSIIIKLRVTGSSWVVPGMQGADELAEFFEQLSRRQLTLGNLEQTPSQTTRELSFLSPGLSGAITEVFRQITAAGFPLQTQTTSEMQVDMDGYMAGIIQSMLDSMGVSGPTSTETIITDVQTGKVAPELFYAGQLPPGYSLNTPN